MTKNTSLGKKAFTAFNLLFLSGAALLCLLPIVHILAVSFSNNAAAMGGLVKLWPVGFTTKSYRYIMENSAFVTAFLVSLKRVGLGLPVNTILTILAAYPLSKDERAFRFRKVYVWFFLITILFGGGLIPWYMTVKATGLLNSVWALIIPGAVPVFNVIILLNFYRELPKELEESAFIDGAGHFTTLFKIYLPLSKPALATLVVFAFVGHWNAWFDGLILMDSNKNYPLQSYLQTIMVSYELKTFSERDAELLKDISDRTVKAAQIFVAMIPIMVIYPFLQKYFTKGLVMGSVKG